MFLFDCFNRTTQKDWYASVLINVPVIFHPFVSDREFEEALPKTLAIKQEVLKAAIGEPDKLPYYPEEHMQYLDEYETFISSRRMRFLPVRVEFETEQLYQQHLRENFYYLGNRLTKAVQEKYNKNWVLDTRIPFQLESGLSYELFLTDIYV